MSRAHAAEKVDGDQGGKADCHCFAHAVDFQTSSDDMEPTRTDQGRFSHEGPLAPPHLLASGMIFKIEFVAKIEPNPRLFRVESPETALTIDRTSDFNNPFG